MLVDLTVDESGHVVAVDAEGSAAACVEKQAGRGAFDCTTNGKEATVRIGIYPATTR